MTDPMTSDASAFVQGKVVPVTYCVGPKDGTMITAANTLEASPKPSYGPHKASERYLDDEDVNEADHLLTMLQYVFAEGGTPVSDLLQALETLRTHLRKKYYAG